ncbi:hypothetical protein FOMG_09273 [Fusarium oxysporum f. sp. melonis 26406]|nr:hypothetical protein FOMG_09273 [Fusarium oxysporum f. sp. melonis 26406]
MASIKSEENAKAESLDSSVGALSLKQESPGGNESEPVQASVSGDDNKPVCLSLEKATTSLQTVESKEYTEGYVSRQNDSCYERRGLEDFFKREWTRNCYMA